MANSIQIVKGCDANTLPFTAFILCDEEDVLAIQTAKANEGRGLDFSKLKIIYQMHGHIVSQKIKDDVVGYVAEIIKHRMKKTS